MSARLLVNRECAEYSILRCTFQSAFSRSIPVRVLPRQALQEAEQDRQRHGTLMKVPHYNEYLKRVPETLKVNNKAPARTILEFLKYSPGKYFQNVHKPIFVAPCLRDNLAPAYKTIELAAQCPSVVVKEYDCDHFDIYFDPFFEKACADYLIFLNGIQTGTGDSDGAVNNTGDGSAFCRTLCVYSFFCVILRADGRNPAAFRFFCTGRSG